jgi:hypothetical protein
VTSSGGVSKKKDVGCWCNTVVEYVMCLAYTRTWVPSPVLNFFKLKKKKEEEEGRVAGQMRFSPGTAERRGALDMEEAAEVQAWR